MPRAHLELVGALGDEIVEGEAALVAAGDDDVAQFRNVLADWFELLDALGLEQNRLGGAVVEPVHQRVGAEQLGNRQRNRADTIEAHVRDRGLRPLRQMHRDHVSPLDSQPHHRVGKTAAQFGDFAEGVGLDAALVILVIERRFVAQIGMAIETIDGDVVVGRDVPSMARAGVCDTFCAVDGLLAKADDAHGGNPPKFEKFDR